MPAHEPSNGSPHPWPADGQAPVAERRAGVGAVAVGRSAGVELALGPDERVDFGAHQLVDDLQTDRARGGQKALARMGGERREMALDPLREGDGQGWRGRSTGRFRWLAASDFTESEPTSSPRKQSGSAIHIVGFPVYPSITVHRKPRHEEISGHAHHLGRWYAMTPPMTANGTSPQMLAA